jgi:hypothetical protein
VPQQDDIHDGFTGCGKSQIFEGDELQSPRGNAVLEEGHGFSRAANETAVDGFSRWGTVFLSSEFSYALIKRCPQGL